jgi:hypothetical protein
MSDSSLPMDSFHGPPSRLYLHLLANEDRKFLMNNPIVESYRRPHATATSPRVRGRYLYQRYLLCQLTTCFFRTDRQCSSIYPAHALPGYHGLCRLLNTMSFLDGSSIGRRPCQLEKVDTNIFALWRLLNIIIPRRKFDWTKPLSVGEGRYRYVYHCDCSHLSRSDYPFTEGH